MRRRMGAIVALAVLAAPVPGAAEIIALTGGTVHTVSGPTLANATVVIENGRIADVGAGLTPPAGARVVSVAGRHVWPGIVSPNTAMGLVEVRSVQGTRDEIEVGNLNPNVRVEAMFNPGSEHIPVARVNGITTVHVVPGGAGLSGTSALMRMDGWTLEDMTVRAPAGLVVRWPTMTPVRSPWVQTSDEDQNRARDEALSAIRTAFEDARAYWKAQEASGTRGVPRHDRDVRWHAMKRALDGEIPVIIVARRLNQIRAALDFVAEQKLARVVLMDADDAWRVADELRERDIAVICNRIFQNPPRSHEPYDLPYTLPAKLKAAGVRFAISDGGGSGGDQFNPMNTRNLPYEAGMAAAFGLARDEAVRAITLYPAQILGAGDLVGSIERGKLADLIVTDGDLLETTTTVEQVYIAGRPIPMESRHTRLFEQHDARPRGEKARTR